MVRLKVIAFLLALVMAIQMLPVEQIGRAVGSSTWTEELPHGVEDDGKTNGVDFFKLYPVIKENHFSPVFSILRQQIYIHTSGQMPSNHSTDVVSPPPDSVC